MAKIMILSPVHVGTGNKLENPSYKNKSNGIISRYDFVDLLTQIPSDVLLNSQLQKDILLSAKKNQKSKQLYQYIKNNVDYTKIQSKYELVFRMDYELSKNLYDVSEQIKSLNLPYIPGSTIKGAITNALFYFLIKNNPSLSEKKIESIILKKNKLESVDLLPLGELNGNDKKNFLTLVASCIYCDDIQFENMELYQAYRVGAKNGREIPLPSMECISMNQCVEQNFIRINEDKIKQLKQIYDGKQELLSFLSKIEIKTIFEACNLYTQEMLEEELSNRIQALYAEYRPINQQLLNLRKMQQNLKSDKKNSCLIRLGNSTNYNFKTVSLFIKKKYPKLYNQYYENVFSPVKKSNSNTMPRTRVVLSNQEGYILPGFIQVIYD